MKRSLFFVVGFYISGLYRRYLSPTRKKTCAQSLNSLKFNLIRNTHFNRLLLLFKCKTFPMKSVSNYANARIFVCTQFEWRLSALSDQRDHKTPKHFIHMQHFHNFLVRHMLLSLDKFFVVLFSPLNLGFQVILIVSIHNKIGWKYCQLNKLNTNILWKQIWNWNIFVITNWKRITCFSFKCD